MIQLALSGIRVNRDDWSLSADGVFTEGIHLVTGDTGSGKSTLALALAGLFPPVAGNIEKEGIASSMIVFQFPEFHVTGTGLRDECMAWGVDPAVVLAESGFTGREAMDPLSLSRGELKRLILACVLAKEYDLLILDEPFGSLDCAEKERLCIALSARKRGITILFTHEQTFFPRVDRIWEIQDGALHDRGRLPAALDHWDHAPALIKTLLDKGNVPANISPEDLKEALCRT